MKKILSFLLILTLVLSMTAFTFAIDDYDVTCSGFDFDVPARLQQVEFNPSLISARWLTEEDLTNIWASFIYDEALPENVRSSILQARFELASGGRSPDWVADGFYMRIYSADYEFVRDIPNWRYVFPYWDLAQVQGKSFVHFMEMYEKLQENVALNYSDFETRSVPPSWSNITVPVGIRTIMGPAWSPTQNRVEFANTALNVPRFNINAYLNGHLQGHASNLPPGERILVQGTLIGNSLLFARGTYHTSAGIGSFRINLL